MRLQKLLLITLFLLGVYLMTPLPSFAARNIAIVDYYYDTHFSIGETVTFTITLKNNDNFINDAYALFVVTKQGTSTGVENYTSSVSVTYGAAMGAGATAVLTTTWTATEGIHSVTVKSYDSLDAVTQTVYAPLAIHVGSTIDSVAAFPRVIDLGALQYGRYMHPMPIEVNWSFYSRSTQVRKDHPWYMRLYTDNHRRYEGVTGAIYSSTSPAGLVSTDGKYTIPLKIWCLNYGPSVEDGWDTSLLGPPPIKEDLYWKGPLLDTGQRDGSRANWSRIPDYIDMTADPGTWRKLIGQDPYNTQYVSDSNPTGDFTLSSPFQVFIAYETSPTAVIGRYSTDLILEIYSP